MKTMIVWSAFAFCLLLAADGMRAASEGEPKFIFPAASNIEMERAVKHRIDRFVIFPLSGDEDHITARWTSLMW
ncbi:MAG: hypothetical protein IPL86_17495 [Flavobacteriales bacterium]|nr:hypothetical protein [Flavobacteriales bacterium]